MRDVIEEELRLIELFREKAADRRRELVVIANERFEDDRKRRHEVQLKREEEERKLEEVLATPAQLAVCQQHLDEYDTAAVRGIMETRQALDLVVKQREEMERAAYRLPDGRMVFKTEDGQHVFDRHGVELGRETVRPEDIPDGLPTWNAVRKTDASEEQLNRKLDQWHSYHQRVDEAQEVVRSGNASASTLAKVDADLKSSMPDATSPFSAADGADMINAFDNRAFGVTPDRIQPTCSMASPLIH